MLVSPSEQEGDGWCFHSGVLLHGLNLSLVRFLMGCQEVPLVLFSTQALGWWSEAVNRPQLLGGQQDGLSSRPARPGMVPASRGTSPPPGSSLGRFFGQI